MSTFTNYNIWNKFRKNWVVFNVCVFLGHVFNKSLVNIFMTNFDLFIKVHSTLLSYILLFLRDSSLFLFKVLTDICAYELISKNFKYVLVYNLLSIQYNYRLFVVTQLAQSEAMWSIISIYKGANWLEREIWDLFGIFFKNHSDLRRILTDYNFKWHPLQKKFPLTGYMELFFNDEKKKILYYPLDMSQEFREFSYSNGWN